MYICPLQKAVDGWDAGNRMPVHQNVPSWPGGVRTVRIMLCSNLSENS